jgi:hypothetical protein
MPFEVKDDDDDGEGNMDEIAFHQKPIKNHREFSLLKHISGHMEDTSTSNPRLEMTGIVSLSCELEEPSRGVAIEGRVVSNSVRMRVSHYTWHIECIVFFIESESLNTANLACDWRNKILMAGYLKHLACCKVGGYQKLLYYPAEF